MASQHDPSQLEGTDEGAHLERNFAGPGDELEELGPVGLVETPQGAPEPGGSESKSELVS